MAEVPSLFDSIIEELVANAKEVDELQIDALVESVLAANRIFVAGAGRSGFVARAFANRLMHLGFTVYFASETTTPAIQQGDLLVVGSGSGNTKSLVAMAQTAKDLAVPIVTLTIFPDHAIGKLAKNVVKLPGTTNKFMELAEKNLSAQPMGNVFEQLSWLVYDTVVTKIKAMTKQSEKTMHDRHANLE